MHCSLKQHSLTQGHAFLLSTLSVLLQTWWLPQYPKMAAGAPAIRSTSQEERMNGQETKLLQFNTLLQRHFIEAKGAEKKGGNKEGQNFSVCDNYVKDKLSFMTLLPHAPLSASPSKHVFSSSPSLLGYHSVPTTCVWACFLSGREGDRVLALHPGSRG